MLFPDSFYQQEKESKHVKTEEVTGYIEDAIDFIESPDRPWDDLQLDDNQQAGKRKKLIFADHFHDSRSRKDQIKIEERLREALMHRFEVYYIDPEGKLVAYTEFDIDYPTYYLPPDEWKPNDIREFLLQHNLSDDEVVILDLFGINALLGREVNQFHYESYHIHPQEMAAYIHTMPNRQFDLTFETSASNYLYAKEFQHFIQKVYSQTKSLYINITGTKNIDTYGYYKDFDNLTDYLYLQNHFPIHLTNNFPPGRWDNNSIKLANIAQYFYSSSPITSKTKAKLEKLIVSERLEKENIRSFLDSSIKCFPNLKGLDICLTLDALYELDGYVLPSKLKVSASVKEWSSLENITMTHPTRNNPISLQTLTMNISNRQRLNDFSFKELIFVGGGTIRFSEILPIITQKKQLKSVKNLSATIDSISDYEAFLAHPLISDTAVIRVDISDGNIGNVQRQNPRVKELTFTMVGEEGANLNDIFNQFPNLVSLTLGAGPIYYFKGNAKAPHLRYLSTSSDFTSEELEKINLLNPNITVEIQDQTCYTDSTTEMLRVTQPSQCLRSAIFTHLEPLKAVSELTSEMSSNADARNHDIYKVSLGISDWLNVKASKNLVHFFANHYFRHLKEFNSTISTVDDDLFKIIKKYLPELALLDLREVEQSPGNSHEENRLAIKKLVIPMPNIFDVPFDENLKAIDLYYTQWQVSSMEMKLENLSRLRNLKSVTGNIAGDIITFKMYLLMDPNSKICLSKSEMLTLYNTLESILHYSEKKEIEHTINPLITESIKLFLNKSRYVLSDLQSMQALIYSFYPNLSVVNLLRPEFITYNYKSISEKSKTAYFSLLPNKNAEFTCEEYFPGVHPALYRLKIRKPRLGSFGYDTLIDRANFKPWVRSNHPDDPEAKLYEGKALIPYGESLFYVLPSLRRNEVFKGIQAISAEGVIVPENEYRILFDPTCHLLAIEFRNLGNYFIRFQLLANLTQPENLPPPIKKLLDSYLLEFKEAKEDAKEKFLNSSEFAKYLRKNKVGRCELRVLAACDEIEEANQKRPAASQWQYNTAGNTAHEMIEICYENKWYLLDLGGYAAKVLTHPITQNQLTPLPKAITDLEQKQEQKPKQTSPQTQPHAKQLKPPKKVLLNADTLIKNALELKKTALLFLTSNNDLAAFYIKLAQALGDKPRERVYCAYQISDLRLQGVGMTAEGEIIPDYKPLHRWLKQNKTGCIVIDIRRFKDNEIAQLNDLLDRRLEHGDLAPGISFILIDLLNAREYDETFDRRIACMGKINEPLQNTLPSISAEDKSVLPIDLFQSHFWKRNLIGQWAFRGNQHKTAFAFQPGPLLTLKSDSPYKRVHITNAPKADHNFEIFLAELLGFSAILWADKSTDFRLNIDVDPNSSFDWEKLAKNAKLYSTVEPGTPVYVLSGKRLLSFIQTPRYIFEEKTELLIPDACLLEKHNLSKTPINIVPFQISDAGLAEFMSKAEGLNVRVHIIQDVNLPHQTNPLFSWLTLEEKPHLPKLKPRLGTFVHPDPFYALWHFLSNNKNIGTPFFSLAALTQSELARVSDNNDNVQDILLQSNKLTIHSRFSDIAKRLFAGKNIILMGKIPSELTPVLKELALGYIDNKPFKGKIFLITTPDQLSLAKELSPIYEILTDELTETKIATPPAPINMTDITKLDDEARSVQFEQQLLSTVMNAFETEPVVKIVGDSGSGKSYFADNILPKKYRFNDIVEWLEEINKGDKIIFVIDEGNFAKQIGNENAKLIERFVGLAANKRTFHPDEKAPFPYKGKIYYPSKNHCLLFLCNPASMGAGRTDAGLIHQLAFSVHFKPLPYYHLRTRMLPQHLKDWLKHENIPSNGIVEPIIQAYKWLREAKITVTPREQILIYNIIFALVQENKIRDPEALLRLASYITYEVLSQLLDNNNKLLIDFQKNFMPLHPPILYQSSEKLTPEQTVAYSKVQCILHARKWMIEHGLSDIGLAAITLEGPSEIGKTFVMSSILKDAAIPYTRIAPLTDEYEKAKQLKTAFHAGHLVVSEEINTGDWPQALLNQLLSGRDDKGNPADHPGFLFLGTRNPTSYRGRKAQDESARQRTFLITLNTAPYPKPTALAAPNQLFKPSKKRRIEHGSLALKQNVIVMSVESFNNLNWIDALPKTTAFKIIIYTPDTSSLIKALPFIQQMARERPNIQFVSPADELQSGTIYNFITEDVEPCAKTSKAADVIQYLLEDDTLQNKYLSHVHSNIIQIYMKHSGLTTFDEIEFAKHAADLYFRNEESLEQAIKNGENNPLEAFYLKHLKNISQDITNETGNLIFYSFVIFIKEMRNNIFLQDHYLEQLIEIMNPASLLILHLDPERLQSFQEKCFANENFPLTAAEFKADTRMLEEDLAQHIQQTNTALSDKLLAYLESQQADSQVSLDELTTAPRSHQHVVTQLLQLSLDLLADPTAGNVSIYNQHASHLIHKLGPSLTGLAAANLKNTLVQRCERAEQLSKYQKRGQP